MSLYRWAFASLIVVAAAALWLLLAGPAQVLGIDVGNAGFALLISTAWISLYLVASLPGEKVDASISPGEWNAWIGVGFTAAILAYALTHATVFQSAPIWHNPDANRVGRNIVLMLIAWIVLAQVLRARWQGRVQEDERDRDIAARACEWARGSLVVFMVGMALLLGFSPVERLQWAPPPMLAHLLIVGLIVSCLIEYVITAMAYWRDRR